MTEPVVMPREALEALLEDAAERGAKKALSTVGLGDEEAPEHIRGLRDLFAMYRVVRNGALKQIGQGIALVLIGALVLFVSTKIPTKLVHYDRIRLSGGGRQARRRRRGRHSCGGGRGQRAGNVEYRWLDAPADPARGRTGSAG